MPRRARRTTIRTSRLSPARRSICTQIAVIARLRDGMESRAAELIREGPPFDLDTAGFKRHSIFLSASEVVFVFEGDEVEVARGQARRRAVRVGSERRARGLAAARRGAAPARGRSSHGSGFDERCRAAAAGAAARLAPPKPLDRRFEAIVFEWDAAAPRPRPRRGIVRPWHATRRRRQRRRGRRRGLSGGAGAPPLRRVGVRRARGARAPGHRRRARARRGPRGRTVVRAHPPRPARTPAPRRDVPDVDRDPGWTIEIRGLDPKLERVHEALLTVADGRLGTRGNPLVGNGATAPQVVLAGAYAGEGPGRSWLARRSGRD